MSNTPDQPGPSYKTNPELAARRAGSAGGGPTRKLGSTDNLFDIVTGGKGKVEASQIRVARQHDQMVNKVHPLTDPHNQAPQGDAHSMARAGANEGYSTESIDWTGYLGLVSNIPELNIPQGQSETTEGESQEDNKKESKAAMGQFDITVRQYNAIRKYPDVIEFLGTNLGEPIVKKIVPEITKVLASIIGNNSMQVSKTAAACVADNKNLKQYFKGDGWLCCVTARGPFTGAEAFDYDKETDNARILRSDGQKITDVTALFNVITDGREAEPDELPAEIEEKTQEKEKESD